MKSAPRQWLVGVASVCAAGLALRQLNQFVPVAQWPAWLALQLVVNAALFHLGAAGMGHFALRRLPVRRMPALTRLAIAGPLGVLGYVLGAWLVGVFGALNRVYAIAWVVAGLVLGGRPLLRTIQQVLGHAGRAVQRAPFFARVGASIGAIALAWLYLGAFTPHAVNYDASWNHLVIAQDYAREHRMVPFLADWVKNLPHLGSIINTWAFLVPGLPHEPSRWMQALHLEFGALVWTLVGVAAVASRLLRHRGPAGLWGLFALFPGLWVYDSNMGAASDHYAALFAAPLLLAALEWLRRRAPGDALLMGLLGGAALATKLQGVFMLAPIALLCVAQGLKHRSTVKRSVAFAVLGGLISMGPHLLRNLIYFHNPLYPMAQGFFPSTPSVPNAPLQVAYLFADWRTHPPEAFVEHLIASAKVWATFGFEAHYSFVGNLPVFGFLFLILTVGLLALPNRRALWVAVLLSHGAIACWAWLVWVDRNLQVFAPWIWATSLALWWSLFRLGGAARAGLSLLAVAQFAWNAGLYVTANDRVFNSLQIFEAQNKASPPPFGVEHRKQYRDLGDEVGPGAVVLLHNSHVMLGLNRTVLLDWVGFQGLFDYRPMRSVADVGAAFTSAGVTHVAWRPWWRGAASKQEEVLFGLFSQAAQAVTKRNQDLAYAPLKSLPALDAAPLRVVMLGFGQYRNGLYPVENLGTCEEYPDQFKTFYPPLIDGEAPAVAEQANVVFQANGFALSAEWAQLLATQFGSPVTTGVGTMWRRR